MNGKDFKMIAKMHLDAYIKDNEEYAIETKGYMDIVWLKASRIQNEGLVLEG